MLLASWKRSATLSARSVSVAVRTIFRSSSDGSDATFVSVEAFVPLLDDEGAICPVFPDDDPELFSVVPFPPVPPATPDVPLFAGLLLAHPAMSATATPAAAIRIHGWTNRELRAYIATPPSF